MRPIGGLSGGGSPLLALNLPRRVQSSGVQYFFVGETPLSETPLVFDKNVRIVGAALRLEAVDAEDYEVRILKNGSVQDTLPISGGVLKVSTSTLSIDVDALDEVSVLLARTSGSTTSSFRSALLSLRLLEL